MGSNNSRDFMWGGWLKPYQYILGGATEVTEARKTGKRQLTEATAAAAFASAFPTHGYKVGDILFGSTDYGMTIPHFYKVTRLIGATKIEVVELALQQNGDGWWGQATPSSTPKSAAKIFMVKKSGSTNPGIKINNYLTAQKWDGKAAMYNYLD